ncbi:hypothetical protein PVAP13_J683265 [Panicum virgatum]|nr:hypothetical protein PVAP13_J683265 [Panicum virgatum]
MDHGSASSFNAKRSFRFTRKEVKQMEEKLKPRTTSRPDRVLMRELALKFSESRGRAGTTTPVTPKQVLNWFRYRRYYKSNKKVAATKAPPPATGIQADQQRFRIPQQLVFNPICAGELVPTPQVLNWFHYHCYNKGTNKVAREAPPPPAQWSMMVFQAVHQPLRELTEIGPVRRQDAGSSSTAGKKNNPLVGDLTSYEAKSASNGAWYDVHNFLFQRSGESGDREVLVHFSGFGAGQAEWINARTSLRRRSLPCNTKYCGAVKPRDIVLCYKLSEHSRLYFDAQVDRIIRKPHDSRAACDCKFLVRYLHDRSEECVSLRKLCLRPEKLQAWLELQKETNS